MQTTMRQAVSAWQGLGLRLSDHPDHDDCPSDVANVLATALVQLGGAAPANVVLLALQRDGYRDAPDRILDALVDAPQNFAFYAL